MFRRFALPSGLHPCSPAVAPFSRTSGALHLRDSRSFCSPFRLPLALKLPFRLPVGGSPSLPARFELLRPLLTSRSAPSFDGRRPLRREARSPQVRFRVVPRTAARIYAQLFGHESFAVMGPLALSLCASYPVSVRQLAVLLPASFSTGLATGPVSRLLRLAVRSGSLRPTSPEDFHLLDTSMLGTPTLRIVFDRPHTMRENRLSRPNLRLRFT